MKNLVVFLFSILYLSAQDTTLSKSIYLGWARGTNIGGVVGIGLEKEIVQNFSISIAVGSIHPMLKDKVSFSKFDFDIGLKYYVWNGLFFGLNYGMLDYNVEDFVFNGHELHEEKYFRGFSVSTGVKFELFEPVDLSLFIGLHQEMKEIKSGVPLRDNLLEKYEMPPITMGILFGYSF